MILMGTYIGTDLSCGYKTGHVYKIKVEGNTVIRLDGTGWCPYRSLRAFFRNWTNVRGIDG